MIRMLIRTSLFGGLLLSAVQPTFAESGFDNTACVRPGAGSEVPEPIELRSQNGSLQVDLTIRDIERQDGSVQYCYVDSRGNQAPTLRLKRGDRLTLTLKNEFSIKAAGILHADQSNTATAMQMGAATSMVITKAEACASTVVSALSTNLHFHGMTVPARCHQDDVLFTSISPDDPPFRYEFQIPESQPPGLYWYHPHIHGFTKTQVLGGASGAIIVEGIEAANKEIAGLPERVLIIRDQDLVNPDALPSKLEPLVPTRLIDRDGDAANTSTGFGKPAKDVSLNFVPIPYPDYPTALIRMKPEQRQFWRVLNASTVTYLDLAIIYDHVPQPLGLVALDGAPSSGDGRHIDSVNSVQTHIAIPPGGRAEFTVTGPPASVTGLLVTKTVDTGPSGENDPNRALARIVGSPEVPDPRSKLALRPAALATSTLPWLGSVTPVRVRHLYFSEKLVDANDPRSATEFYLTVDGQKPMVFDPSSNVPNIIAKGGTVEDWIIENRSTELHAFHIHQVHFMLMEYLGMPVNEPFLRDTINVPYLANRATALPSIRVRMDFRDPSSVGTSVYHCHLLEHEDGGMMGLIRVDPPELR